jgi:hypothetical protein
MNELVRNVVACNIAIAEPSIPCGALAYVIQVSGDRVRLLVRSMSGRWVKKWLAVSCAANFRFKSISESNPMFDRIGRAHSSELFPESALASLAANGAGQGLTLH